MTRAERLRRALEWDREGSKAYSYHGSTDGVPPLIEALIEACEALEWTERWAQAFVSERNLGLLERVQEAQARIEDELNKLTKQEE